MIKHADVVIIGGGAAGTSVAFHLARLGAKNVVLVEQEYTPFGGTGRSAAHFRLQFGSESNCRLGLLSAARYDTLGDDTGFGDLEISKHGYLLIAHNKEQLETLKNNVKLHKTLGIPSQILDPQGCSEVSPYLNTDGVLGGSYCTGEGHINPLKMALAYKQGAERLGVKFYNYTRVTGIKTQGGKVRAVVTDKGEIETPCVVNAAGEYGKYIGRMAGVTIPVEPEKHQIAITEPVDYVGGPMLYSYKHATYIAQVKHGGFLFGWSDPNVEPGIIDFDPEWQFLETVSRKVIELAPALKNLRIIRHWAGQYGTAPDHSVIIGKVPELDGFICALGCTKATMFSPAIGILVSEVIAGMQTTLPMAPYTIDRFAKGELVIDPALL